MRTSYRYLFIGLALVATSVKAVPEASSFTTYQDSVAGQRQRTLLTRGLLCKILLSQAGKWLPQFRHGSVPVAFRDLEAAAKKVLRKKSFDYVAGGAGTEKTLGNNRAAFDRWRIVRRVMTGNTTRSLQTELFGKPLPAPVILAPVGALSIVHRQADLAAARAAAHRQLPFTLSMMAQIPLERVAAETPASTKWFQLYWTSDVELNRSLVARAEAAGYSAIVVTVDQFVVGWRERDLQNGYIPFLLGESLGNFTSDPHFRATVPRGGLRFVQTIRHLMNVFPAPGLSWNDLATLRSMTTLPILVKGIMHPDDATRAVELGANGIIVSNHGGRQIDGEVAALDMLPRVVAAVGGKTPVLFDSGIRNGSDVFKAVALGARAVLLGRPWVYGLAIAGQRGVEEVLENLLADLYTTMALAGHGDLSTVGPSAVEAAP